MLPHVKCPRYEPPNKRAKVDQQGAAVIDLADTAAAIKQHKVGDTIWKVHTQYMYFNLTYSTCQTSR